MIRYQVDISLEFYASIRDAIDEARELIKTNEEVVVYKCYIVEDTYNEVYQRERVFSIEKYENGEIKEFKYEN